MHIRRTALATAFVAVGLVSFAAGTLAQARFGEVDRAEQALRTALADLQRARDIFGGHKRAAEGLISQALTELQVGKRYAAEHGQ